MKKTLAYFSFCLLLFLGMSFTGNAQTVDPPIDPKDSDKVASILRSPRAVSVIFHIDIAAVEVEVVKPANGELAYRMSGQMTRNQQLTIDSEQLPEGWYLIRVIVARQKLVEQPVRIE